MDVSAASIAFSKPLVCEKEASNCRTISEGVRTKSSNGLVSTGLEMVAAGWGKVILGFISPGEIDWVD